MCKDFQEVIPAIAWRGEAEKERAFVYADPPYIGTANNYSNSFVESDFLDLLDSLIEGGLKFAISEFDNEFVIESARAKGLTIEYIGERNNLKNRRTEILITNYQDNQQRLFI